MTMQRRTLLSLVSALLAAGAPGLAAAQTRSRPAIEVWKDPDCGCCHEWIAHLKANGIPAVVHDVGNGAARARLGMPDALGSCHTGLIGGYAIEGHVPAADIQRLLRERPNALGLAVPGMPIGSPGMDAPIYRGRRDAFDVLLVQRDGRTSVFRHYPRA